MEWHGNLIIGQSKYMPSVGLSENQMLFVKPPNGKLFFSRNTLKINYIHMKMVIQIYIQKQLVFLADQIDYGIALINTIKNNDHDLS